jgi:peptidyl-prolyl cis-trans isomerase C
MKSTFRMSILALLLAGTGASQLAGAQSQSPAPAGEPKVIAVVNGQGIPPSALERALRQQVAMGQADTPELRARLRDNLITQELLYQEAVRLKLDQNPGFRVALESAKKEALSSVLLQAVKTPAVPDAEVRKAYDEASAGRHPEDFLLRAIVVADEQKARQIRSSLARGGTFEQLAAEHSQLPSARQGGSLGWLNVRTEESTARGPIPTAVRRELRKLSKGSFTPAVADRQGRWWIVKIDDTRPAEVVPFEQAAPRIRQALEAAARTDAARALVAQLREKASIAQ